jgi:hypothetical protein
VNLPSGLVVHCAACNVVIPSDAPRPAVGGDCAWVARGKMAPPHPNETIKGQHAAATAAWHMIYHKAITGATPDAASVAYLLGYQKNPKQHFVSSAARQALTPAQVAEQQAHPKARRDAAFYK